MNMAYVFQTNKDATMKTTVLGKNINLAGVDGVQNDANVIINGVNQLYGIVGWDNQFVATDAKRVVTQNVYDNQ